MKNPKIIPDGFTDKLKSIDSKHSKDLAKNLEKDLMVIFLVTHEMLIIA